MRATLLESNPDIALVLPCVFKALGIPLAVVGTVDAVRRATRTANLDDIIVVDCSLGHADDRARCAEVVGQTALGVHIIYDPAAPGHATFQRDIERMAHDDVKWLPATVGLVELVTILRDLRDQALQEARWPSWTPVPAARGFRAPRGAQRWARCGYRAP